MIPLGDDFRYNKPEEFDWQYKNYKMIMDYVNNKPELYANVRKNSKYWFNISETCNTIECRFEPATDIIMHVVLKK